MAKRSQKRLMRMEVIIVLQVIFFMVTLVITMGYAYWVLRSVGNLFDTTNDQMMETLNGVEVAIDARLPLYTELLDIHSIILIFKHQFELVILDPDYDDKKIRETTDDMTKKLEVLADGDIKSISARQRESLLESMGILIDIGEELAITNDLNDRQQLYNDTLTPMAELLQFVDQVQKNIEAQNTTLRTKLVANTVETSANLRAFKKHANNLEMTFLFTIVLTILVPGAIQLIFFRKLRIRLLMLAEYANDIGKEKFQRPPFLAKDRTGQLAIRLALMGRRIRKLLRISRVERERADTAAKELERLAYYDTLTGLQNRRLFHDNLSEAIELSKRRTQHIILMFLDLDNFKDVNDAMGHEVGDELLKAVALRLTNTVRSHDHLARLGGDEFAIIAFHQSDRGQKLAERLHHDLTQPVIVNDLEVHITVSIGIAPIDPEKSSPSDLLCHADMAMYHAKSLGRNTFQHFSDEMQEKVKHHQNITRELRDAIKLQQFQLYYQPQIDLKTNTIKGVEALIRWLHPERGMVRPDLFIPVAEETGLIREIGSWVLNTACLDAVDFMAQREPITMAVNISARQFYGSSLVENIAHVLEVTHLPSKYLELEITEGTLLNDIEHAINTLNQLKQLGISIALDDFGTGYSSLSYLKKLPIDVLKIDRGFINHMLQQPKDRAIVKTIVELGHQLNMVVLAEGIETEEQASFMRDQGCHVAQGFLFARPVPMESLLASTDQKRSNVMRA